MGPFPHDAPPANITARNPAGTDGFEFVELAHEDATKAPCDGDRRAPRPVGPRGRWPRPARRDARMSGDPLHRRSSVRLAEPAHGARREASCRLRDLRPSWSATIGPRQLL